MAYFVMLLLCYEHCSYNKYQENDKADIGKILIALYGYNLLNWELVYAKFL